MCWLGISFPPLSALPVHGQPAGCLAQSEYPADAPAAGFEGRSSAAYQEFPTAWSGESRPAAETAWFVTFDNTLRKSLFLTGAWFKPGPSASFVKVLDQTAASEIYVRYASGQGFVELAVANRRLLPAGRDAGRCGLSVGPDGSVVREVLDKGVLWKDGQKVVRGQMMALWSMFDSLNYNYIVRYEFHDDGTFKARMAATGTNLPSAPTMAHTHIGLWRIDTDLGGAGGNSVDVLRHREDAAAGTWSDASDSFNGGREGPVSIEAAEFTRLQVTGNGTTYDLRPLFRGLARHAPPWMRNDFWVTIQKPGQTQYLSVDDYASDRESIVDTDVVLWVAAALLHVPRSEDGEPAGRRWTGAALAMPSGFELRPRNLFGGTPFHPASAPIDPQVEASFGSSAYSATEGETITITVSLNRDPGRAMDIDLVRTHQGGATADDYSGVPFNVRFDPGAISREFSLAATDDDEDETGESVKLSFAALPRGVTDGGAATVAIVDPE